MSVVETKSKSRKRKKKPTEPETVLDQLRGRFGKIQDVADLVPCSRPVVYFAIENPKRYSRVSRRLNELLAQ